MDPISFYSSEEPFESTRRGVFGNVAPGLFQEQPEDIHTRSISWSSSDSIDDEESNNTQELTWQSILDEGFKIQFNEILEASEIDDPLKENLVDSQQNAVDGSVVNQEKEFPCPLREQEEPKQGTLAPENSTSLMVKTTVVEPTSSTLVSPPTTPRTRKAPTSSPRAAKKRRKRNSALPKRALSAYNLFFQRERMRVLEEAGRKVGFEELGKIVGARWKALSSEDRAVYNEQAAELDLRYRKEKEEFEQNRRNRIHASSRSSAANRKSSGVAVVSPGSNSTRRAASVVTDRHHTASPQPYHRPFSPPAPRQYPSWHNETGQICYNNIHYGRGHHVYTAGTTPRTTAPYYDPHHRSPPSFSVTPQYMSTPPPQDEIVTVPDAYGRPVQCRLTYQCVRMTREEADAYYKNNNSVRC